MPHYCKICERRRPNEAFSGRGHRDHICKKCQKLPKAYRNSVMALEEIEGFLLRQSHISDKNLARLSLHAASADPKVAAMARAVLDVAVVAPYKRRRFRTLIKDHRHLLDQLVAVGLFFPDFLLEDDFHDEGPYPFNDFSHEGDLDENPWSTEGDDLSLPF